MFDRGNVGQSEELFILLDGCIQRASFAPRTLINRSSTDIEERVNNMIIKTKKGRRKRRRRKTTEEPTGIY